VYVLPIPTATIRALTAQLGPPVTAFVTHICWGIFKRISNFALKMALVLIAALLVQTYDLLSNWVFQSVQFVLRILNPLLDLKQFPIAYAMQDFLVRTAGRAPRASRANTRQ
jgi:hypothetical protein